MRTREQILKEMETINAALRDETLSGHSVVVMQARLRLLDGLRLCHADLAALNDEKVFKG